MISRKWIPGAVALAVPPLAVAGLVVATLRHKDWNEPFFVQTAYYILWTLVGVTIVVVLRGWREGWSPRAWIRENVAGIVTTAAVSTTVLYGVTPAYRVLADEANLIGVSKNLFFNRTANFSVMGKWYFENYWNLVDTVDRRPALYPFLVSLVHTVRGYHPDNGFRVNAILFVLFVFSAYRLAKCLGGELFGVAAAILVAASPSTLVAARSAGFDLLASLLLLVVIQRFYDYAKDPSPRPLALLSLSMCLLAHVRVEGLGLVAVTGVVLLSVRVFKWSHLRGFGFVYSLVPVFFVSRYWQSVAKANDAEQPLSASLFGIKHFLTNGREYLGLMRHPFDFDGPHARLIMICAVVGGVWLGIHLVGRGRAGGLSRHEKQFAILVGALFAMEVVLSFSYSFGQSSQPASARLFIWLDTLVSFVTAWFLARLGSRVALLLDTTNGRTGAVLTTFVSGVLFAIYLPVASEARFVNALYVSRQAAEVWRFLEKIGDKRILVLSDRPGLYTIMDYGSLDLGSAVADRRCLFELSRHLYRDIYLIQEMNIDTKEPKPGFTSWSDVPLESALEFQITATEYVRIARVIQPVVHATD